MEIVVPWCIITLIIISKCSSYYACIKNHLTIRWRKTMIYHVHWFCGSGIWTGRDKDSLSLLHNLWGLQLEDSKGWGWNYLQLCLLTTCLEGNAHWRLTLVEAVEQSPWTWCLHIPWAASLQDGWTIG